jgi:hypothetical protein
MRKYVLGFMVAAVVFGGWELSRYVTRLQDEAATAHAQAAQGAQAFAFLATVMAKDDAGNPSLTMGDALAQIVSAQLKARESQPAQ